jgi:transposase
MARAYSDDLRGKVLAAYAAGKGTLKELAERFGVSYGWVAKIHAVELRTGSRLRPAQASRGRPTRIDGELVRGMVKQRPDIVLHELRQELAKAGTAVSIAHLARVLGRLGLRLKKSRSTPPSATAKPIASAVKPSLRRSARLRPRT